MIKLIIADDHRIVIDGLIRIFKDSEQDIEVIGTAETGKGALSLLKQQEPDIVILDIGMPDMEQAYTLKTIKTEYPGVRVLILTMYDDLDRVRMMLQSQADGYLLKNRSEKEAVKALLTLQSGERYVPRELRDRLFEADFPREFVDNEIKHMIFTEREEEILRLLAEGYQVKEIADQLNIGPKTVESHKTNLMKKIAARNVQDVVRFAVKNGYCPD